MNPNGSENANQEEKIREVALELFLIRGYAGTTVHDIASAAGVNAAMIYRFFKGKRELFDALQRPELDFPDERELEVRKMITDGARKVFSNKGFSAATMDEICQSVGLSKPALYYYYPSKEKLFEAILENPPGFALLEGSMNTFLADEHADLEIGLVNLAQAYLSLFSDEDSVCVLRIVFSEGMHQPNLAKTFAEKIIRRGSLKVAEHLSRFCSLEPEKLILRIQGLFGMLFSWGLMNRVLLQSEDSQAADVNLVAREYIHQFLYGMRDMLNVQQRSEKEE